MSRLRTAFLLLGVLAGSGACRSREPSGAPQSPAAELATRERRLARRLADSASVQGEGPLARWIMPVALREISGIALTADNRLLAHDDEIARVYVLDYRRGLVLKRFSLGNGVLRGDFEGITRVGDAIYMLESNGRLYEFAEGADGARVPYSVHDTQLGHECEFEGVAYDSLDQSLVLACKTVKMKKLEHDLVLIRWKLQQSGGSRVSMLTVPLTDAIGENTWTHLHPSDITIEPGTGNYVVIAARERALVVLTRDGHVVRSLPLPPHHHQAEGVAITADSVLIVSDEGGEAPAAITLYQWPYAAPAIALRKDDAAHP